MSAALDLSHFVRRQHDGTARIEFAVEGINGPSAINEVEGALASLPGLLRARLNYTSHRVRVEWTGDELDPADIPKRLEDAGYRAHVFEMRAAEEDEQRQAQWLLRCLGVAAFAAMNAMLLAVSVWAGNVTDITPETRDFFHWILAIIAVPAAFYAGQPFFRSAIAGLRARRVNMDVPISLGIMLALAMSVVETINHAEHTYFDSVLMLLFFLLCGRYLDHAMRRRTRAVAGNLAALKADTALRVEADGALTLVPVAALAVDDLVSVRPGDHIPVDGVVVSGASEVDASLVTGETALVRVTSGQPVYAGTINHSGTLTVHVRAAAGGTLLEEIERLLAAASDARTGYVKLADRAARFYSPLVHVTALMTLTGWVLAGASVHDAIITAITVLIITCPCALALAVPTVQAVASGELFRANVFLSSGDAIERLAAVDTVVFDKTGTLTRPEGRVANRALVEPDLLDLAARLALSSRHPLAAAVASESATRIPFPDVTEETGRGVRTKAGNAELRLGSPDFCTVTAPASGLRGMSVVAVRHGARTALLEIGQALRPDTAGVIADLKSRGLDVRILSGDRPDAVAEIADALGVAHWQGGMTPDEKIAALERLKAEGKRVLMVGDGINDAPALAAASVSMSPISAADIAQANADCVFLGESLSPVATAHAIAVQARGLMHGNLWLTVVYNAIAVPVAVCGLVTPLIAALSMSASSLLVTLNALRVRGHVPGKPPVTDRARLRLEPVAAGE